MNGQVDYKLPNLMVEEKNTVLAYDSQHYHDAYELTLFIHIDLEIFMKDTSYVVKDGDMIFINEFNLHRFIYSAGLKNYKRYTIHFQKNYILPNLVAAGIEWILDYLKDCNHTCAPTTLKERSELEVLFKSMIKANNSSFMQSENFKEATVKSYLLLILMRFCELLRKNKPERIMTKQENLIKEIIHYIDHNYTEKVSLPLIEEQFYMDKYHICHIFKEATGFSVIEYLQIRRIIEAQKMLRETNKEIIDICFECGFNNMQHFHRVFKKITGFTPDKYRKQHMKNERK